LLRPFRSQAAEAWLDEFHFLRQHIFPNGREEGVPPVGIAVLDTGIDDTNPYIMDAWGREDYRTDPFRDFVNDSSVADQLDNQHFTKAKVGRLMATLQERARDTARDDTGHGTHVSGIILRLCPEANLFVGRVMAKDWTVEVEETSAAAKRVALVSSVNISICSNPGN
jgi:hypothetical protein